MAYAEVHQLVFQGLGYGDEAIRSCCCPTDHRSREQKSRDEVDVRPAGRDDDGLVKLPREEHCGDTVGVEIMGINEIEIKARVQNLADE
jgi:hypothetical protein